MSNSTTAAAGQPSTSTLPSLQLWSQIVQAPELVGYFKGVFGKAGIQVEETGEAFTVVNADARGTFQLHPGIDPDVDFVVPLKQENVANLVAHVADGKLGPHEAWRIVKVLFTPLTRAALQSPIVRQNWVRVLAGVESVIHVNLMDPNGGAADCHTLAFAGDQWLVIPGLNGKAERTYWLSPEQALEFQRELYKALKTEGMAGWWAFATWYRTWRNDVSKTE
jgi:hypothetical protein